MNLLNKINFSTNKKLETFSFLRFNILFSGTICFFLLTSSITSEKSSQNKYISWKSSQLASGYQVQVKDSKDKIFIDQKTESNYLTLDKIPEGKYKVRTSALSPFGKPIVWTNWQDLQVEISLPPSVKLNQNIPKDNNRTKLEPKPEQKLEIVGENFNHATEASIESPSSKSKLKIVDTKIESKNKLELVVDASNAKPGSYDLALQNPYYPKTTIKNYIEIEDKNKNSKQETDTNLAQKKSASGIYSMSMKELDATLSSSSNCFESELNSSLIKECNHDFVTLNLSTREKKDLYYYFLSGKPNRNTRINSFLYFQKNCQPELKAMRERVDWNKNKNNYSIDIKEKNEIEKMLTNFNSCPTTVDKKSP
jgi:hypothetical protein